MLAQEIDSADLRCGPVTTAGLARLPGIANGIAPKLKKIMTDRRLEPEQLCFVTGWYRSGTTWVSQLIGSHPNAFWLDETNLANSLLPCLRDALVAWKGGKYAWPIDWTEVDWADLACALRGALSGILRRFSSSLDQLAVEKSPSNTLYAPFLSAVWPEAKFVHVLRDPRDVIVSIWRTEGNANHARWQSFDDFARHVILRWCAGESAMARLGEMGTVPHTIRYEVLFANEAEETARLYDFLGLGYTPELIGRVVQTNTFETVSGGRKPGEEDTSSGARQGLPGNWRDHMPPALAAEILDKAAEFWRPLPATAN